MPAGLPPALDRHLLLRAEQLKASVGDRLTLDQLDLELESPASASGLVALHREGAGKNPVAARPGPASIPRKQARIPYCRAPQPRRGFLPRLALRWCFISPQRPVAPMGERWRRNLRLTPGPIQSGRGRGLAGASRITDGWAPWGVIQSFLA